MSSFLYGGAPSGNSDTIVSSKLILSMSLRAGQSAFRSRSIFAFLVVNLAASDKISCTFLRIIKLLYAFNQVVTSFFN